MSLIYWLMGLADARAIASTGRWTLRTVSDLSPLWAIVLGVIAFVAAGVNFSPRVALAKRLRIALALLRLTGFAIVLLALYQVELEMSVTRAQKPVVAVLLDTSESMSVLDSDGDKSRLDAAKAVFAGPLASLESSARVARYDVSWTLHAPGETRSLDAVTRMNSTQPSSQPASTQPTNADTAPGTPGTTRLYTSLAALLRREPDARAVVLLTDGNDSTGNEGSLLAPILAARRTPVFPLVIGQERVPRLAKLQVASSADFIRLGDELTLHTTLSASDVPEQAVAVKVYEQGKREPIAARENVRVGKEPASVSFVIKPTTAGKHVYRIAAEGVKGASSGASLASEREVEVIDQKLRVLYADIPRDERKILGHWLARDPIVSLATLTMMPKGGWFAQGDTQHKNIGEGIPNDEAELFRYDIVILGDVPRAYFRAGGDVAETKLQRLADFVSRRGGGLVTLGGRSVYGAGQYQDSELARLLPFTLETRDESQLPKTFRLTPTTAGLSHPIMRIEFEPQANREAWDDMPMLEGSNLVGAVRPGASLLAVRQTERGPLPMLAMQSVGKGQVLSMAFDTTWRWEMMRSLESEDHYRRFWGNVVRVTAPDPRLSPRSPVITRYKSRPAVGDLVTLSTRLVDESYRPLQGAELQVRIVSPSGVASLAYPVDTRQSPGLYEYDVTLDEPGVWEVTAKFGDRVSTDRIVAGSSHEEMDDPGAKPAAMAAFAKATGGKSFTPDNASQLPGAIDLTPRLVTSAVAVPLWNLPVVLATLIVIVCVDCVIRKRRGLV